jgi:DMSO/TMAO reductase YedYZ molybdopterin-dependent catalytic subunit
MSVGLLAVAAAVAGWQLAAGIVAPATVPFVAVANAVIRFSPQPLVTFAERTFGTADKTVLLVGMAVVMVLVAAGAGWASRRRELPGLVVITVLGLIGFAAVLAAPSFAELDLLGPGVALAAGIGVFRWLHRFASATAAAVGPSPTGLPRRALIRSAAAVGLLSLGGGSAGLLLGGRTQQSHQSVAADLARLPVSKAPAIPPGAAFPESGTPTFRTPNQDFYRVDVAVRIPTGSAADWSLRVHGMVDRELTLSFGDLLARPLVERTVTMTCVSNPVGGGLISTADFIGVELRDLLLETGVRPGADQVLSTSSDGWSAGTPVSVLLEPDRGALLAVGMNGAPLPPEHGFPVRMVVPGLYGYVSATKWLVDIELTTFGAERAYWVKRGWPPRGPIKTQSRIDVPHELAWVSAGRITVAGIAWAPHTGIDRVQVRMDDGPWRDAELSTEATVDCWRMWRIDVPLAPGGHSVQSRATDRTGAVQTEAVSDVGATGWPTVLFFAS